MVQHDRKKMIVLFLLPALVLYGVFFIYPSIQAIAMSLTNLTGFNPTGGFVGLQNYQRQFHDPVFHKALGNTLMILVGSTIVLFALALLFTALLSRRSVRGKEFFRAMGLFPAIIPGVALGLIWVFVLSPNFGMLNQTLRTLGLNSLAKPWLGPKFVMPTVIVALSWSFVGYYTVIMLAGVSRISDEHYDAARVEGANEWQIFAKITLPMIWDVVLMALVLWTIFALKTFEFVLVLTDGGPANATLTLYIYIYRLAFGTRTAVYRMGYAASIGVTLLFLIILVVIIQRIVTRRETIEF